MNRGFKVKAVTVTNGEFNYRTHRLTGWFNGQRIRKQFRTREEAEGEKNRLEVQAANSAGDVRAVNTRLTSQQVAEAETAFACLGDKWSLPFVVQYFRDTYRPPVAEMTLEAADAAFLADRGAYVRPVTLRDYNLTLRDFRAAVAVKFVHEVKTSHIDEFLRARKVGKKRWNNLRGDLNAFFEFSKRAPRKWTQENPVADIPKFKLARGEPAIESAEKIRGMFAFLETYCTEQYPHGFLVPYFALTTFGGIRPSVQEGEIWKLSQLPDISKAIDRNLGVIRMGPALAKTKDLRKVTIQPNLAEWQARYPLDKFPLCVPNMEKQVGLIRKKFGLGHDVLRHTFVSMHVAKFRSLGDTALEAGNSEAIIKKHYLNLVSVADAKAFWEIVPSNGLAGPPVPVALPVAHAA